MSATTAALGAAVTGHPCSTPAELRERLERVMQVIDGTLAHDATLHTQLHASLLASLQHRTRQSARNLTRRATLLPSASVSPPTCAGVTGEASSPYAIEGAPMHGNDDAVPQDMLPSSFSTTPATPVHTAAAQNDKTQLIDEPAVTPSATRKCTEGAAVVVTKTRDAENAESVQRAMAGGTLAEAAYVVTTPHRRAPPLLNSPLTSRAAAATAPSMSPTRTATTTPTHRRLYDVVSSPSSASSSVEGTVAAPSESGAHTEACDAFALSAAGAERSSATGDAVLRLRPAPPRPDSSVAHRWHWLAAGATGSCESAAVTQLPRRRAPSPQLPVATSFSSSSYWLRVSEDASWQTSETWGSTRTNAAIFAPVVADGEASVVVAAGERTSATATGERGGRGGQPAAPHSEATAEADEASAGDFLVDGVAMTSDDAAGDDAADEYVVSPDDVVVASPTPRRRAGLCAPVDVALSTPSSLTPRVGVHEGSRRAARTPPRHRHARRPELDVRRQVVHRHVRVKSPSTPPRALSTSRAATHSSRWGLHEMTNQRVARATHAHAVRLLCHDGLHVVVRLAAMSIPAVVRIAADGAELLFYLTYTTTQDADPTRPATHPASSSFATSPVPPWRSTSRTTAQKTRRPLFWRGIGTTQLAAASLLARSTSVGGAATATSVAERHVHERHHFPLHSARLCMPFATLSYDEGLTVVGHGRPRRCCCTASALGIVCGAAACRVLRRHHCLLFAQSESAHDAPTALAMAGQGWYRVYCVVPHHDSLDDPSEAVLLVLDLHSRAEWVTFVVAVQGVTGARRSGGRYLSYGRALWLLALQRLHVLRAVM